MDQVSTLLEASGVPPQHWLTFVKQQCHRDVRAYDALLDAEKKHTLACLGPDPSNASPDDFIKYYKACLGTEKRGKPQDQKIGELLSAYYTMQRGRDESVPDFAHRFSEVQHQLERYIPNVHKTLDGSEIELIHAFVLKVPPGISKELVSQDFSVFKTLQAVVEAAQRYEVHTQSTVTPDVSLWQVPAADCQISHVKQAHRPNSAVRSNLMNSGTKLKPQ